MTTSTIPAKQGIQITEAARQHLSALRQNQGTSDLCLRVGVRGGGCSGMSYTMDFETAANINPEDDVFDYGDFQVVCDPKSLLYLYGLELDYSTALIGGGFQFRNPNATQTCGCGKSFSA